MLQTIQNKKLKSLLHISFCFLSLLLCVLLIFNCSIVKCFAVALPAIAIAVGIAMLAAAGITFASYEAAETGVNAMYENMDSTTQSGFDNICEKVSTKISNDTAILKCGIQMSADYWKGVLEAIILTFGSYVGVQARYLVDTNGLLAINEPFEYVVNGCGVNSAIQVSLGASTISYIGGCLSSTVPSYINSTLENQEWPLPDNAILKVMDIAGFTFGSIVGTSLSDDITYNLTESMTYSVSNALYQYTYINHTGKDITGEMGMHYFNGLPITKTTIDTMAGTFTWNYTGTGANIVIGGNMLGDIVLPDGICPDGVWTNKSWSDWLNDVIFGTGSSALPGNPSIDTTYTAGNDTWHDGSINDDVAIGDSPSIGISVPTTQDGAISLNPDQARDLSDADATVDATTEVGTNTGTGTGTGSLPNSNPGNTLPALTLPEILFMEKFPFCLPFDLYTVFSMLSAEPKAPKFDIPIRNDRINLYYTITVDLTDFDTVSKISRLSFSVTFVIALILLSRRIVGA